MPFCWPDGLPELLQSLKGQSQELGYPPALSISTSFPGLKHGCKMAIEPKFCMSHPADGIQLIPHFL